jgi:hypothetical protein
VLPVHKVYFFLYRKGARTSRDVVTPCTLMVLSPPQRTIHKLKESNLLCPATHLIYRSLSFLYYTILPTHRSSRRKQWNRTKDFSCKWFPWLKGIAHETDVLLACLIVTETTEINIVLSEWGDGINLLTDK